MQPSVKTSVRNMAATAAEFIEFADALKALHHGKSPSQLMQSKDGSHHRIASGKTAADLGIGDDTVNKIDAVAEKLSGIIASSRTDREAKNKEQGNTLKLHQAWQETYAPLFIDALKDAQAVLREGGRNLNGMVIDKGGSEWDRIRPQKLENAVTKIIKAEANSRRDAGAYHQTPLQGIKGQRRTR